MTPYQVEALIEMIARQNGFAAMSIHNPRHFEAALEQIKPTVIFLDVAKNNAPELLASESDQPSLA